jgi:hypothetical protein
MAKNRHLSGNMFTKQPLREKETSFSSRVEGWLNHRDIWNMRIFTGKVATAYGSFITGAKKGTPDRLAIFVGIPVFIETKMIGEKPSPEQLQCHEDLRAAGAVVIVAQRLEDLESGFDRITKRINL